MRQSRVAALFRGAKLFSFVGLVLIFATPADPAPAMNWAATDTAAFNLNLIPNATDLGAASSSTPLQLLVSLKLQNTSLMYGYFQHITTPGDSLYGHYLSTSEFNAMYSPSMSQAEQVIGYLHAVGFTDISLSDNRTLIRMNGTVGLAQSAFSTQLELMQYNGQTLMVNTLPALVPAALGNLVLSIIGLDTVPKMHFNHPIKAGTTTQAIGVPSTGSLSGYGPQNFQSIYDADLTVDPNADPSNPQSDTELNDGRNAIIAIIAEGDLTSVVSDLAIFESNNNLPVVTPIVIKTAPPALITDTSGSDEYDLDTQTSTGMANNVKNLYVYDSAALSDVEIVHELNQFVSDDFAPSASFSVGGCETLFINDLSALDQVFVRMAIQGQTLFASAGDSGASCLNPAGNGVPAGVPGVEYPASSPYVVGVGGTTLTEQAGTSPAPYNEAYDLEVAWYAGGGGTSIFEIAPSWQIPVLPTGTATSTNTPRGVPDIAMDADANTPANVVVNGATEGVGGTSLASPLSLGSWARMQSVRGNNLGYAPPDLYALDSGPLTAASGFHDIIVGDNAPYPATPGWDYDTGLGSFDIAEITPLLIAKPFTITPNPVVNTGNVCKAPGLLLIQNTVSGLDTPLPGDNPEAVYVAETYAPGTPESNALTFTLNVDTIAQSTLYLIYFTTSDGVQHYLAYESTTDGTTPFTYGHISYSTDPTGTGDLSMLVFNQDGVLDSASSADTTTNVIVYVLPKSGIPAINGTTAPDNTLTELYAEAGMEVGFLDTKAEQYGPALGLGIYDSPQSSYTPIGNSSCATGTPVITGGTSTGGTTGGASTGGTSGGSSTGGTSGGSSTGGTSGGSSTGGTSGGSSTGGTSGGTSGGTTIGGAYCTLPGVTLESSSTGTGTTLPYLDIIGLDVAEPYPSTTPLPTAAAPSTSITFTITLSSLLSSPVPPPDTEWSTVWVMPKSSSTDKISHQIFVSFDTISGDLMGTISYGYVDGTVTPHTYETQCTFGLTTAAIMPNTCPVSAIYDDTSGTIALTLNTSTAVPFTTIATGSTYAAFAINFNTSPLPVLTGVLAQTQILAGAAGTGLLETESTTGSASYQLNGNYSCMSATGGTSTGGTTGGSTGSTSGGTSTGGTSGGSSTGGTSGGSSTGGTSGGSSTGGTSGGTSTGGTTGGASTGGTSGGSSTGGTSGGSSTGGTSGGSSTGGTSGGSSTGGTSGGSSTGGTSGGSSTGGTSGGSSTGGTSGGSSTGGTSGGSSTGGTSGGSTGGTSGGSSTGGTSGSSTGGTSTGGGTSGGTTGGGAVGTTTGGTSTGGSDGGTSTGGTSTGGDSSTGGSSGGSTGGTGSDGGSSTGGTTGTTTTVGTSGNGSSGYHGFFGGSFGEALVPLALLAGVRRRRKTLQKKRA